MAQVLILEYYMATLGHSGTWQYLGRFHKELGRVTRPNLGLILRSACYSAGLGLVLSPKINLKLGRVL